MAQEQTSTGSRCPVCGEAELQSQTRTERFEYDNHGEKVSVVVEGVPVSICPACGESFSGADAGRVRDEAICRALGLLTPAEIRTLRDRLGLSQAQFARLTGIGEATISRWEQGQLIQSRALDRYLRLLAANPGTVKTLETLVNSADSKLSGELANRQSQGHEQLRALEAVTE